MYEVVKPYGELIKEFETREEAQDYAFSYFNEGYEDRSTSVVLVLDTGGNVIAANGAGICLTEKELSYN